MQNNRNNSITNIGLVIAYHGKSVAVEHHGGQVITCQLHRNQPLPVVGDQVYYQITQGNTGVVTAIVPRKNALLRGGKGGRPQMLAANIDYLFIVMTFQGFSQFLLDRYLLAAELLDIVPVIVINKVDLLNAHDKNQLSQFLKHYEKIPYDVIWMSTLTGEGVKNLEKTLHDRSAVFVGPSGVGKSSMIASLTHNNLVVGEVSDKGMGRHTTTATRLYHLNNDGKVIDSPGVREFSLWNVTPEEILKGFKEFQSFLNQCKFRDCAHLKEPHCAIKKAVEEGMIHQTRYDTYKALMKP